MFEQSYLRMFTQGIWEGSRKLSSQFSAAGKCLIEHEANHELTCQGENESVVTECKNWLTTSPMCTEKERNTSFYSCDT